MYTKKQEERHQELYAGLHVCMARSPLNFRWKLEDALAQGYPINFQSRNGDTLLLWSVEYGDMAKHGVPEILLEHGADPNIAGRDGEHPLYRAIFTYRPLELIERLIKAGADTDAMNNSSETVFNRAAWRYIYGYREEDRAYGVAAVQFLLEHGADPYLCSNWLESLEPEPDNGSRRRRELQELCDAYLTRRNEANRRETKADIGTFMR